MTVVSLANPQQLPEMTIVAKKIGGKWYVYEQSRVNGKVVTRYIGPLDRIARAYELHNLGVNYPLSPRDLQKYARKIAEEVVSKLLENTSHRCGGRDSNPGRPTPADLKNGIRDQNELRAFFTWLVNQRGISRDTARDYVNYLSKPLDVDKRHSVIAYRLYYKFKGWEIPGDLKPVKKYKPDLRVPSESEILKTLEMIGNPAVKQVYLVLLQTGLRLSHAVYLLNHIRDLHVVPLQGYYRVDLNLQRGRKKAWVAYLLQVPEPLKVSEDAVSNYAKPLPVKPKYIRKFVITKMHQVGVESDVVRFIVGHGSADIHVASYYDRLAKADVEYAKYASWLKNFLGWE